MASLKDDSSENTKQSKKVKKIRYILQCYSDQRAKVPQFCAKIVIVFTTKMLYQNQPHAGILEMSILEMRYTILDQSLIKSMKFLKTVRKIGQSHLVKSLQCKDQRTREKFEHTSSVFGYHI